MTPRQTSELIDLVTGTDLSYAEIAKRVGVTKNAALGKATRLGLRGAGEPPPTTIMERLDALHAALDAILAVNPPPRVPDKPPLPLHKRRRGG